MSIFDELVEELKGENLLEETVLDLKRLSNGSASGPRGEADPLFETEDSGVLAVPAAASVSAPSQEFFRKRAMEEVSTLQMVEHVLSGIEREHMKMSPRTYDELEVKKALHRFMQAASSTKADEIASAETAFYSEAQNWSAALSHRDRDISVANLRRYCENSRPVLSSQALIALARFYRNSPFSEAVRGKFDFVMTRLFSRDIGDEKRKLLFPEREILGHISVMYSNWSSLSLREPGEEVDGSAGAASVFRNFIEEAEGADKFDDLVNSDFFNRIRLFKEQSSESFFEPAVVASAINCNVQIGNRFIELIQAQQAGKNKDLLEEKYGYTYDTIISNAAGKTLLLQDLLKTDSAQEPETRGKSGTTAPEPKPASFERAPVEVSGSSGLLVVNKWLAAVTILVIAVCGGVFLWAENSATTDKSLEIAPAVEISDPDLRPHLRKASSNNETLYAQTETTWDAMSEEDQKAFLSKAFVFAKSKGMRKVSFLNGRGRTVAFASDARLDIYGP